MNDNHWFADITDEKVGYGYDWQPFLQASGSCLPLPIWFKTKEQCEEWIRDEIVSGNPQHVVIRSVTVGG